MKTVVLLVAYDGTLYSGMQNQQNGSSIQSELEMAVLKTIGYETKVVAAGRTDAGVHARGMVCHTRVEDDFRIAEASIKKALNTHLKKDIRVLGSQLRSDDLFHARFDALAREYSYSIMRKEDPLRRLYSWQTRYRFDTDVLSESASVFRGVHNFTTFSKLNDDVKSYICNVDVCEWQVSDDSVQLSIRANRFVYGMVRSLVGAMMDAARSKRSITELSHALNACDRKLGSSLAPARGLVFEKAHYKTDLNLTFS